MPVKTSEAGSGTARKVPAVPAVPPPSGLFPPDPPETSIVAPALR